MPGEAATRAAPAPVIRENGGFQPIQPTFLPTPRRSNASISRTRYNHRLHPNPAEANADQGSLKPLLSAVLPAWWGGTGLAVLFPPTTGHRQRATADQLERHFCVPKKQAFRKLEEATAHQSGAGIPTGRGAPNEQNLLLQKRDLSINLKHICSLRLNPGLARPVA